MKVCILAPRYPFPENGGDVLRINNIARYLKSQGHELILVSFREHIQEKATNEETELYDFIYTNKRNRFTSALFSLAYLLRGKPIQCGYYHSPSYQRLLKRVINKHQPDIYISHLLRMVPYLEVLGETKHSIIEMTDALSKTYGLTPSANGSRLKKNIYSIEKDLIKKYEQHVINVFPKVVLVSPEDVETLNETHHDRRNVCLHSNGVDACQQPSTSYNRNKICFIGNMRTLQNQDAVIFFIKEIFPLITKKNVKAEFHIVGAEPPQRIKALASDNIFVTGYIPDLMAYIKDAVLAVAPIRIAAGIQNKVLVAMGHKIPVVMTSLISKAIPELKDSENCLIRDNSESFAQACLELMNNPKARECISLSGYNMVKQYYSWQSKLKGYELIPT